MFCKHCGIPLEDTVQTCPNCGTDLTDLTAPPVAPEDTLPAEVIEPVAEIVPEPAPAPTPEEPPVKVV